MTRRRLTTIDFHQREDEKTKDKMDILLERRCDLHAREMESTQFFQGRETKTEVRERGGWQREGILREKAELPTGIAHTEKHRRTTSSRSISRLSYPPTEEGRVCGGQGALSFLQVEIDELTFLSPSLQTFNPRSASAQILNSLVTLPPSLGAHASLPVVSQRDFYPSRGSFAHLYTTTSFLLLDPDRPSCSVRSPPCGYHNNS